MITTYNQAKRLKELGFNEETIKSWQLVPASACNHSEQYGDSVFATLSPSNCKTRFELIPAPSISEALQWIREKYKIVCGIGVISCCKYPYYGAYIDSNNQEITLEPKEKHPLAESALLDELLTYLEQKR